MFNIVLKDQKSWLPVNNPRITDSINSWKSNDKKIVCLELCWALANNIRRSRGEEMYWLEPLFFYSGFHA